MQLRLGIQKGLMIYIYTDVLSSCNDPDCRRIKRGSTANFASNSRIIGVIVKGFKSQLICSRRHSIKYSPFCLQLSADIFYIYFRRFRFSLSTFILCSWIRSKICCNSSPCANATTIFVIALRRRFPQSSCWPSSRKCCADPDLFEGSMVYYREFLRF